MSRRHQHRKTQVIDMGGLDLGAQAVLATQVPTKLAPTPVPISPAGLTLSEALEQSSFLRMAARCINDSFVLVANGRRFWTASLSTFEPVLIEVHIDDEAERSRNDWRPVVGSEKGLRLG